MTTLVATNDCLNERFHICNASEHHQCFPSLFNWLSAGHQAHDRPIASLSIERDLVEEAAHSAKQQRSVELPAGNEDFFTLCSS